MTSLKMSTKRGPQKKRATGVGSASPVRPDGDNRHGRGSPTDQLPRDEVGDRLAMLRPSRELLDYYRRKVTELSSDHEAVLRRLEQMGDACGAQQSLQWDLRQREDEIAELQKALSDMQMYLFQEREQVLRLYAENDRLKIRELEDRKKVQHLLQLSGLNESEVTYFLKDPPSRAVVPQRGASSSEQQPVPRSSRPGGGGAGGGQTTGGGKHTGGTVPSLAHEAVLREVASCRAQVDSLQSQLEEQTRLAKEQVDTLMEDRRIRMEEVDAQRKRDQERITGLADKLKKTQDLLYDSSKDFLEQRNRFRRSEKDWISEKDRLLQKLDSQGRAAARATDNAAVSAAMGGGGGGGWRSPLDGFQGMDLAMSRARVEASDHQAERKTEEMKQSLKSMEYQLGQQQKLADMYREQVIQMEDDLSRAREEGDVSKEVFKDRSEKISKRLQLMNQRYQDLERRRNLEVQGFQTDIAGLRKKLRNLEKQLYKVTLGLDDGIPIKMERPADIDLAILKNVRNTAGQSKKLSGELKNLKAMMYGLENEMRRL